MVSTCRPCSGATPAESNGGTTRNLDADNVLASAGSDVDSIGGAATISTQHGEAGAATGSASAPMKERTSPPAAKNTAAGAIIAARTAGRLRRSLANEWRPTKAPYEKIGRASC